MTLTELYRIAEENHIEVDEFPMRRVAAVSFPEGWIALNPAKLSSPAEVKVCLAHELGHCQTGSFYSAGSACDVRGKNEAMADRWAYRRLVPRGELESAVRRGLTEPWELADYFDVPEPFLRRAMEYYAAG